MDMQLQSTFFRSLPREIRDMIYVQFWEVSGSHQHVFEHQGSVSHFPCIMEGDQEDTRNKEFEDIWHRQQSHCPKSVVRDAKWAKRMSSTWHEHWRCEEAILAAEGTGNKTRTLFLPTLLACKQM